MKKVIIVGSSRDNGNTMSIAKKVALNNNADLINLNNYYFSYYDYESKNKNDDFLPLIRKIIENYNTLIFCTPVYWYSMSGILKVFFDRFSDLIRIEKDTGRKLRNKNMYVISNSHDDQLDYDFYIPFKKSAEYLGMHYLGNLHFNADTFQNKSNELELINLT